MFEEYEKNFFLSNERFLARPCTGIGSIISIQKGDWEYPYSTSALGPNARQCILKMYSEASERLGFSVYGLMNKRAVSFDVINKDSKNIQKKDLKFGENKDFGFVDTTGTGANRSDSSSVLKKAVSELVEKNDLFLFWYLHRGTRVKISQSINLLLKKHGMSHYNNFVFECGHFSNWLTCVYVATLKGRIVTTGISCSSHRYEAIEHAIEEGKVLRMMLFRRNLSGLEISDESHKKAINFLEFTKFNENHLKARKMKQNQILGMSLASEITNLRISVNSSFNSPTVPKLITAFSSDLLKCVPEQQNLRNCRDTSFWGKYGSSKVFKHIDCIVS